MLTALLLVAVVAPAQAQQPLDPDPQAAPPPEGEVGGASVVVPAPPALTSPGTVVEPAQPPPAPRGPGLQARLSPYVNMVFISAGGGLLGFASAQWVTSLAAGGGVVALSALAAESGGPIRLAGGEVPLPDPPPRLGGNPGPITWTFTTSDLTLVLTAAGAIMLAQATLSASFSLFLLAAGATYPQTDTRGLVRFLLRSTGFHAFLAALLLGTGALVMGTVGLPLAVGLLFSRTPQAAAAASIPPQWGPLLVVGAFLCVAAAAVSVGSGMQVLWTSTWGPAE